ncbi:MAG: DNA polymerase Y family protein [Archangium sp.]|nr:DNA polymerase Y family protein [Archangium sp.]MDP3155654.1 DNA polymerase Y family protein [Archangium sp.]MDP3570740.1 DNA polymerase Y family protein [Archangium sp.]
MRLGYLYLPRFPVQRRVLEQPSLAGRPLVLHADEKGSQRVRFASGAALKRGVRPGMTVASAMALEPSLVRLRFEPELEAKALATLGETLLPLSPGFQRDAPEGLWLDASAAPLSGTETRWAERVLGACRALGFRGRCVVGSERFSTQALGRWTMETVNVVPPRGGAQVAKLPLLALEEGWLGEGAAGPFRSLGLSTLGELAGLPSGALVGRFGTIGLQAARLSRGEDDSRFLPDELPEVLEEQVQLDWPAEALEPVLFALKMLVDRLCGRLQGRQRAAVRLTVSVGLEGGTPLTVPLVLARASAESRLLVELIRHRLTDLTVNQPITTLSLRVDEASEDHGRQLVLGDAPAGEVELEVVMSRLQSALGEDALFSAAPLATHRPEEAWTQVAPLSPSPPRGEGRGEGPSLPTLPKKEGLWPKRKAKKEQHGTISLPTQETRPPRLFKEPARLNAELSAEGAIVMVTLAGRRRKVEALTGPERLVGSWWSPDPFSRDYYRLQLEGVGQLWVFRDGNDGAFYAQGVFD